MFRFGPQGNRIALRKGNTLRGQLSDSDLGTPEILKDADIPACLLPQFFNFLHEPSI